MIVDIAKLRGLQKLYEDSKTAPPDAMVPNDVLGQVRADDRTYHFCNFINALHHAAPTLLEVFEAAVKWRNAPCDDLPFCERGEHEYDCAVSRMDRELVAVVDETRRIA